MGGVGYVVALHPPPIPALTEEGSWPSVFVDPIRLFRVADPLPRAYAVEGVRIAGEPTSFAVLADPQFDPRHEVILPSGTAHGRTPGFVGTAAVVRRRSEAVEITAELNAPGHVVLLESYDPGWSVTVDGAPAELLRANVIFRAAAVPAGRHKVQFRYRPPAAVAGAVASALTLAAGLAFSRRAQARLIASTDGYSIRALRMSSTTPADRPGPPRNKA
jgi:hypothetical protein